MPTANDTVLVEYKQVYFNKNIRET